MLKAVKLIETFEIVYGLIYSHDVYDLLEGLVKYLSSFALSFYTAKNIVYFVVTILHEQARFFDNPVYT